MKRVQFYILISLTVICLIATIVLMVNNHANHQLQAELEKQNKTYTQSAQELQTKSVAQQNEINKGAKAIEYGTKIIRELAVASAKDDKIMELLNDNGIHVQINKTPKASEK